MDMAAENRKLETLAWGLLFIWLGVWWSITENSGILPAGTGAIGVGMILLGLNGARWLKGISINVCSTALGIMFLILGGMKLACRYLHCSACNLSILGVFLVVFGAVLLARELLGSQKTSFEN
jgi:hypothetical protein